MSTFRSQELLLQGHDYDSIQRATRLGELTRVRHGGYATDPAPGFPSDRHRQLIEATVPLLQPGSVLSHASAGLLWGLPVPNRLLARVHTTRHGNGGGKQGRWLHSHTRPLPDDDHTILAGLPVTGLARTAVDLSCLCDARDALAIMDAAWRALTSSAELAAQLEQARSRTGVRAARWALAHANPLAESAGESFSRYWMINQGLPMPMLQYEVRDAQGRLVGRADFAWEEVRVLGEFDGRVKYQARTLRPGQTVADVVMAEKQRENSLRDLDWWVYRWTHADLTEGIAFARRLLAFLDRKRVRIIA